MGSQHVACRAFHPNSHSKRGPALLELSRIPGHSGKATVEAVERVSRRSFLRFPRVAFTCSFPLGGSFLHCRSRTGTTRPLTLPFAAASSFPGLRNSFPFPLHQATLSSLRQTSVDCSCHPFNAIANFNAASTSTSTSNCCFPQTPSSPSTIPDRLTISTTSLSRLTG